LGSSFLKLFLSGHHHRLHISRALDDDCLVYITRQPAEEKED
jgi:hypothetical protein